MASSGVGNEAILWQALEATVDLTSHCRIRHFVYFPMWVPTLVCAFFSPLNCVFRVFVLDTTQQMYVSHWIPSICFSGFRQPLEQSWGCMPREMELCLGSISVAASCISSQTGLLFMVDSSLPSLDLLYQPGLILGDDQSRGGVILGRKDVCTLEVGRYSSMMASLGRANRNLQGERCMAQGMVQEASVPLKAHPR